MFQREKIKFTKREKEIIQLIMQARCRKHIADELSVSIHTIDAHLRNIYLKTNTHSMLELFAWTVENHLIHSATSLS